MKRLCALLSSVVAVLVLGSSGGEAWAIPSAEAVFVEQYVNGSWLYSYTLYNTSDPAEDAGTDLYDFFLDFVQFSGPTLSVNPAPVGWSSISDNTSFIVWFFPIPGNLTEGSDIAPGTSLSGFDFTSNTRLASLPFTVMFVDPNPPSDPKEPDPSSFKGTSTPVPEPATLWLLGSGLAAAGFFWRSKSHKP